MTYDECLRDDDNEVDEDSEEVLSYTGDYRMLRITSNHKLCVKVKYRRTCFFHVT